jgi:hypothetical protein
MILLVEQWHYTTLLDALDRWQALIAGALGFAAAIIVVYVTLRIEQRKMERELDALRKSLAVELRQHVVHALRAGKALINLSHRDSQITARMVQSLATVPPPIIYPSVADKIGLLGHDAMDVVIIYSLIDTGRGGVASLVNSRTPDDLTPGSLKITGDVFLNACAYAQSVLPKFTTGVAAHDEKDAALIENIGKAVSANTSD